MTNISDDVKEAIVNEFQDILEMVTENVVVTRLKPQAGSICLWQFEVYAPSHYLEGEKDITPKSTDKTTFWMDIREGYPMTQPHVYYLSNRRLASANVFKNGTQCIDEWVYDEEHAGNNTSLVTTVRKTIKDIIHDPSVCRFDSPANGDMIAWQKGNIENYMFPTCSLSHVFKMEGTMKNSTPPALPSKKNAKNNPPSLPVKEEDI